MHSAVLQNKKYIKFADKNTVEVIALSRLDEAVKKKDRKAATYKTKGPDGQVVERMVNWPSLTYDEMIALNRSKAGRYNKTGRIPYTCIVDPYTEEELGNGYRSAKAIMEAVKAFRKQLVKEHGKGIARKTVRSIEKALAQARALTAQKQYGKAVAAIKKVESKKKQDWPESLTLKLGDAREDVLKAAKAELEEAELQMAEDKVKGKRFVQKLITRLQGTGLENDAKALLKSASSSN